MTSTCAWAVGLGSSCPLRRSRGFNTAAFGPLTTPVKPPQPSSPFAQPWELTEVRPQPFPVPAAVVFGARVDAGELVAMPAMATWWKATVPDHYRSWEAVGPLFSSDEREVVVATGEFNSPYADLVRQGSNLVPRVLLAVREREAGPLYLAVGRVAVESARLGGEKPPWRDLRTQQGEVEVQFLMGAGPLEGVTRVPG